ncbi:MAG: efflux RND transporter periplasmic adaptor subunit [Puniceicoccales bacterium]
MSDTNTTTSKRFPWRRLLTLLLIVGLTVLASVLIVRTGPKATRRPPAPMQANVKIRPLERTDEQIIISAMGSVIPRRSISLSTQVSGEVVEMGDQFIEGGFLQAGDFVLQIDDRDYQTALASAQATLDLEMSDMAIELGNQNIAKREWELILATTELSNVDSSLALREPQLKSAEAEVAMARVALEQAEIDMARTRVTAPFNAIVLEKFVDLGAYVSPQTTIASLAGTDTYWVRVAVPKSELQWMKIPGPEEPAGSTVRVYTGTNETDFREGTVIALLGDLDPAGRMARVLVSVDDPFSRLPENADKAPLLLGDYVRVDILGKEMHDIYSLPREAFRDGGRVWLANENDQLEVRSVDTVWRGDDFVIVETGLSDGERLIVSNLSMPTPGLRLVVADESGQVLSQPPSGDSSPQDSERSNP